MKIPSNDQLTRIGEVGTVVDEQKTHLPQVRGAVAVARSRRTTKVNLKTGADFFPIEVMIRTISFLDDNFARTLAQLLLGRRRVGLPRTACWAVGGGSPSRRLETLGWGIEADRRLV